MGTVLLGHMDSCAADTADCACNKNHLSRLWSNAKLNHLGAGRQHKWQSRCVNGVKPFRDPRQFLGLAHYVFSVSAIYETEDMLANLQAGHTFPKRKHFAGEIAT
jgi:hypothetical protein